MKRFIKVIIAVILILVLVSSCSQGNTIKIGFVGTLTGPARGMSEAAFRGFMIAVDEINNNGGINGRQIEVVEKNDLNDSEIAMLTAEQFINEKIEVVIGHYSSGIMSSVYENIKEKDILYLSPVINASSFNGIDDNLIKFNSDASFMSDLVYQMADKNGDKNFLLIYDSNNELFASALRTALLKNIDTSGGKIVEEIPFNSSMENFGAEVTESVKDYEADAIFLVGTGSAAATIITEIRLNDIDTNIYLSAWSNSTDFISIGGGFVEGVYMINPVDIEGQQPEFIAFKEKFYALYGNDPEMGAVFAYETMKTLERAIKNSNRFNAKNIKKALLEDSRIIGLQGTYELDEFGDSNREYIPMIIENGKMVKLD